MLDTPEEVAAFCTDNMVVIGKIADVLQEANYPAARGEQVLLWLAGLSMGSRSEPLITGDGPEILARAWQLGAKHGS